MRHQEESTSGTSTTARCLAFRGRLIALSVLWLGLVSLTGGCAALSDSKLVAVGVDYWDAQVGGSLESSELGLVGDRLDVESTLDIDDEKVWVYHGAATVGPTRIEATFIDLGYSGVTTLANSIDFSGQTFGAGNVVSSDLETSILQLHAATGLYNWNIVKFGFIAGLDQLKIDSTLVDETALITASQDFNDWVPVVGITAEVSLPLFKVEFFAAGEISGIIEALSLNTIDGSYLSSEIRGGVNIDDGFKFGIGYRSLEADFDDGGANFDLDLGGGFLFLELEF